MPIVGLTDKRKEESALVFPQIGMLRKGGPKIDGKRGRDLDHFRFTSDNPEAVKAFRRIYGKEPKAILGVVLPYRTVEENFPTWKEEWSASRLQHRCDGVNTLRWYDKKSHKYVDEPKACPGGCKEIGRLTVVLSEMMKAGFIGTVTVLTSAKWDLLNINNELTYYYSQNQELRGIEWVLNREPKERPTPDGPRRMKHEIHIRPHQKWVIAALQLEAELKKNIESGWVVEKSHRIAATSNENRPALPEVAAEFEEEPTTVPDPPKKKTTKKATALRQFHALGRFLYGTEDNWKAVRPAIVAHVSGKKKISSADLTIKELDGVNNTLTKKKESLYAGDWDTIYSHIGKMLEAPTDMAANVILQIIPDMADDGFEFNTDWFAPLLAAVAGLIGSDLDDPATIEKATNFFRKEAFGELPF